MFERLATVRRIDDRRVHRFQVVRERRGDGDVEEWIVVDLEGETVRLADPDFQWTREVPVEAFLDGTIEPVTAGDVPVWGY